MVNTCSGTWLALSHGMLGPERRPSMPWPEVTVVSARREFCALARRPGANVSALCQRYGISRTTGYTWLARAEAGDDPAALVDRSRRPHTCPHRTDPTVEEQIVTLRDAHPTWGARKLKRRLEDLGADDLPAVSTITAILARAGRRDLAQPVSRPWQRFEADAPNWLWQIDFTGHFALAAGRCHPLPVLDDHSRFLLGLTACANEQSATVQAILTTLFRRYGLPWKLLCDNGSPWGTTQGPHGLTELGVWLVRVGVTPIHGRPFHPQTQGKLERVNRTLLADAVRPGGFATLGEAQRVFDRFRTVYNQERPHEALGFATPLSRYTSSPRPFPEHLPPVAYAPGDAVRMVDASGRIQVRGRRWRVGHALAGQPVALRPTAVDGVIEIRFCHLRIRELDLRQEEDSAC